MNQAVAVDHHEIISRHTRELFFLRTLNLLLFSQLQIIQSPPAGAKDYFFVQRLHLAEKKLTVEDGWHQLFVYFQFTRWTSVAGVVMQQLRNNTSSSQSKDCF